MARLEYQANLGRSAHLKLAWKLGQELRPHKPGAGAAPPGRRANLPLSGLPTVVLSRDS